ncbi:MAG: carboxypeptidase M32 [Fimbriimonadaceae bacterium]|nr:carboxypeptidase M32 [Fimbriimonadaceae bacterium]
MPVVRPFEAIRAEIAALDAALKLLSWDRQTVMSPGGASARAEHTSRLARQRHALLVGDEFGQALDRFQTAHAGHPLQAAIHSHWDRERAIAVRTPVELALRIARVGSEAYSAWRVAKPADDFDAMAPYLAEQFGLARELSDALRQPHHADVYDPLLDLFEPRLATSEVQAWFGPTRTALRRLLAEIREATPICVNLSGEWNPAALRGAMAEIIRELGFDFDRGRLDLANNAFCANISGSDLRMTTRASDHLRGVYSSSLHEFGHAIYEQSVDDALEGTGIDTGVSLSVHESQSRLWENIVGRSRGFLDRFRAVLVRHVPGLERFSADDLYRGLSAVEPTYLRVGADEVSYSLHIMIRFDLERALLNRELDIRDLPEAWNARYAEDLGVTVRRASEGCLQDVHWPKGSIGYFPTYAIGNLIGGQLLEVYRAEPTNARDFEVGKYGSLREWLAERIYRHGSRYPATELIAQSVGGPIDPAAWLRYLRNKYGELYGLSS